MVGMLGIILCSVAVQECLSQCCLGNSRGIPSNRLSRKPLTLDDLPGNRGGSFIVVSSSPVRPTGITIVSNNTIDGSLLVTGEIPFLSAVDLDGVMATSGEGAVNYGCGDQPAILNEIVPNIPKTVDSELDNAETGALMAPAGCNSFTNAFNSFYPSRYRVKSKPLRITPVFIRFTDGISVVEY